jgi:hypothetical protein
MSPRSKTTLVVFGAVCALASSITANAETVTWNLAGNGDNLGNTENFHSSGGQALTANAWVLRDPLGPWWGDPLGWYAADIHQTADGLGVDWGRGDFLGQLDNFLGYDLLQFELPDLSIPHSTKLQFSFPQITPDAWAIWGNNTNSLPDTDFLTGGDLNGTLLASGEGLAAGGDPISFAVAEVYKFLYFGTVIREADTNIVDAYRVKDLAVQVVPIPAAAWLFGSALVGMAGIGYRRSRPA